MQKYRIGDLVKIHEQYHPSQDYICRIMNIVDSDGIEHFDYNVITGNGDKNSKLVITLNVFAYMSDTLSDYNPIDGLCMLDEPFITTRNNMHEVYLIKIDELLKNLNKQIFIISSQIQFFKTHRNREDKLDEILA